MKDFIQIYKKRNFVHNLSIIGVSLVLALGIHFTLGGTPYGQYLKSSVIDATQAPKSEGDMYLQFINNGDSIGIKSSKKLSQVTKLSFSISYNPNGLNVNSAIPTRSDANGQNIANTPGLQTTFIIFPTPQDIQPGETIATLQAKKILQTVGTGSTPTEYINLFSVNTEDANKNITEYSSSGIDF